MDPGKELQDVQVPKIKHLLLRENPGTGPPPPRSRSHSGWGGVEVPPHHLPLGFVERTHAEE